MIQTMLADSDIAPAFVLALAEQGALQAGAVVLHEARSNLSNWIALPTILSVL
jgi:hypothetical protein